MALFSSFKQKLFPSYLGVDIGTTSIKVVEAKKGKRGEPPQIVNYAYLEAAKYLGRENSALQSSSLKLFEREIIDFLITVIREMKPKAKEVIASLPIFSAFITILSFPDMPKKELRQAFEFEVKRFIPLPVSEVSIEWNKIGEYEDERGYKQQQILLFSIPNEQIKKYQNIFKEAGLKLKLLELESFSLIRSLIFGDPTPTTIVDIGSRSTTITFSEDGELKFTTQTDLGGASLTQALVNSLNINYQRAEDLKRAKGITSEGAEFELSTILIPHIDAIINEVKRADFTFRSQFPQAKNTERIILTGGGANLKGIDKYFNREFNIPVVKAAPFTKFFYPKELEPALQELNPIMSVSLGLTLQALT